MRPRMAGYKAAQLLIEEGVEIIAGGFPCQDISAAGRCAGITGSRSGLWREMLRTIRLVRPKYAVVENVAALLHRGMGTVLGDLAESGYDTEWNCISAADVGAPHLRERIWVVAGKRDMADTEGRGCGFWHPAHERAQHRQGDASRDGGEILAHADSERKPQPQGLDREFWGRFGDGRAKVADSHGEGLQGRGIQPKCAAEWPAGQGSVVCYPASTGFPEWAGGALGQPSPLTQFERSGSDGEIREVERNFCGISYGLSRRVDRLRALGNSVVPQIPEIIGKSIMESMS